jgi:hypothetical protein
MFEEDKNPSVTAGVADPQATGASAGTVTETAVEALIEPKETAAAGVSEAPAVAEQKGKQTPEDNAAFARLRREADDARRQLQERDRWVEQRFGAQGIHTWDQYQAAVEAQRTTQAADTRKKRAEELRTLGVDPAIIDDFISSHPEVQALQRENAEFRRRSQDEGMVKQFEELTTEFPHIKEASDVDAETWRKYNVARGGMTLLDAYISAHSKDILAAARGAGAKDAMAKLAGKSHLATEKSLGKTAEEIDVHLTDEQLGIYDTFGFDEKKARAIEREAIKRKGGK